MYLLIFEDGSIRQSTVWDGLGGGWEQGVRDGVLEVIRFEPSFGNFERYDPDNPAEWIEV